MITQLTNFETLDLESPLGRYARLRYSFSINWAEDEELNYFSHRYTEIGDFYEN